MASLRHFEQSNRHQPQPAESLGPNFRGVQWSCIDVPATQVWAHPDRHTREYLTNQIWPTCLLAADRWSLSAVVVIVGVFVIVFVFLVLFVL